MLGFAQPNTNVATIMKNFLTALVSALLVAVIVTSLHYFVFSSDMNRAPLALFFLSFIGMSAVALFNVRLSALRNGLAAPAIGQVDATKGRTSSARSGPARPGKGDSNRNSSTSSDSRGNRGSRGGRGDKRDDKNGPRNADSGSKSRPPRGDAQGTNASSAAASSAPSSSSEQREPAVIPDGPRETGTVKWFNRSKGFGFIVRPNGEEIFVHHRSIRNSDESRRSNLRDGQDVNYVVADHSKGQQAEDVVGE